MKESLVKTRKVTAPVDCCPYWSLDKNDECGMTVGGVYLPLPSHINMFCLTSHYIHCHQYVKGCESIRQQRRNDFASVTTLGDRRKMRRFAGRFNLTMVACDPNSEIRKTLGFQAMTLDVSLSGLRIESPQELTADTIVGFELDSALTPSSGLSGVGKVMWCSPRPESDKYECGLSFAEDLDTIKAVKECLLQ